jgi:hypothetical protein
MNKKLIFGTMLVCLLALSLALIGCPTDDDGGGSGGGVTIAEKYRGVYVDKYGRGWTLEVKASTLEVKKGDGAVKTIQVESVSEGTNQYLIHVSNVEHGGSGGWLMFVLNEDGSIKSIDTNGEGKLEYYPGDTSGEQIPQYWEK